MLLPLALLVSAAIGESAPFFIALGAGGIPSLVELMRSLAAAARAFSAERVVLESAQTGELTARTAGGAALHLMFDRWTHPNARLGVDPHGTTAFVRVERGGELEEGPYRSIRQGAASLVLIDRTRYPDALSTRRGDWLSSRCPASGPDAIYGAPLARARAPRDRSA